MVPMQAQRMRLPAVSSADGEWLREVLDQESRHLGARIGVGPDGARSLLPARLHPDLSTTVRRRVCVTATLRSLPPNYADHRLSGAPCGTGRSALPTSHTTMF
jgi:hypothetical protein